jgi:hypothetical protein
MLPRGAQSRKHNPQCRRSALGRAACVRLERSVNGCGNAVVAWGEPRKAWEIARGKRAWSSYYLYDPKRKEQSARRVCWPSR